MPPPVSIRGYEVLERIGTGAESMVFRAREVSCGRIVAIKHVSVEGREKHKYLRHVRNEYRTLRNLQDGRNGSPPKGIVKVYGLLKRWRPARRKEMSLIMEYVDGPDLRRERRYPLGQIVDILSQVASALSALHARGILHGDMKPENIVVDHGGRATVVDFGFSCRVGSLAKSVRGTRDYMAPEQVAKQELTEKTEIYNFGATMYFLLAGRHLPALIPGQGDVSHFISSRKTAAPVPRSLNPGVPPMLDQMVMRCVKKEPLERPSCIEEVLEVLLAVRGGYLG